MTLSRLAAETGLSTALLSKLETERMIPTLPTLSTICRVYGVGLGHFFTEPTRHSLSVTRKAHLDANTRTLETAGAFPLNSLSEHPALTAEMVELTAVPFGIAEPGTEICAFFHVLEGSVQLMTDGLAQKLETGDCAYMETRMPTALTASGGDRCRILLIQPSQPNEGKK